MCESGSDFSRPINRVGLPHSDDGGKNEDAFIGLLGAGLVFGTPAQAKFIGTAYYMPNVMLCKSQLAHSQFQTCTSRAYVIGTWEQLAGTFLVCRPDGVEYEDMLRVVVKRIETRGRDARDTRVETEFALRNAWPCKK
jgi:hypothetical protein